MASSWQQGTFASALIDRKLPVPEGLTSWNVPQPQRRFSVYRNNVSGALAEALAVRFPVVQRLVGDEFFHAMAREYALHNLPKSAVLIHYGADFPDFVAEFEPAKSVPYLADVARLDSAHWESYHERDATPLGTADFAALDPGMLPQVRFELLPSLRIVTSIFPIVSIWRTNTEDAEVQPVDLSSAEDALVARPDMTVEVRRLPAGGAAFLKMLQSGDCLGDATASTLDAFPEFDLPANLQGLIASRLVSAIIT